ncbi:MAG: Gfo/Idh/MocA family oxidoreductase [Deltaproteobacteria bacterium]|nr:Gfo/Idh/MocA family oxidoreductase [Deltaproteobacteria bacterium]MBW2362611.1 Gfo/Idh/MocA family oxidoreductase [Deltaproteobacteria bacterium]
MAGSTPGAIVVGTGFGVLTHLRALRAAGFEARALVGRDPEKTRDRAAQCDVPVGLTSLSEALELADVDAVTIATPPHSHCAIALEAIAAGKHIVCEKPFARNAEEAQRMHDAAEAAGVIHLMGNEFRFATGQALATRAVRAGEIGEPRLATFLFQMPSLADASAEVPAWWSEASEGGGWLGAYASHVIDHMRCMLGEFTGLSASLQVVSERPWTADDSYTIHFRTESGAEGVLQSSAAARGPFVACSRVVGSQGTLWIEGDNVHVADKAGERQLDLPDDLVLAPPSPPPGELLHTAYDMLHSMGIDLAPFTRIFEVLAARMRGEPGVTDPAPATFADGLAVQKVLDAVRLSAAERRWVAIE